MTDPVSIISTAVGITSLGAQLCQAVVNYYTQYKSFDNDIDGVLKRAEVLELTLEALESVRKKDASKSNTASKQLKLAIEACAGSLMALKIMTIKLGEFRRPTSIEDRRRLLKDKLLWPFKQVTLLKLGETLNEVQSNVQLAIQVLEMDTGHERFETIQSNTRAVFHCGNRIERHLDKHTHQLDAIQKYSRNSLDFENQAMSRLTQLTLQLASLEQRWTQPVASPTPGRELTDISQNPSTSSDPMLKEQARIVRFGELSAGNEIHNSLHSRKSDESSGTPVCTCRKRTTAWWWKRLSAGVVITASQETEHRSNCPYFQYGRTSYNLQGRFSTFTKLLGFHVELGISYTKMPGRSSICPMISISREMPDDCPMFAMFSRKVLRAHCTCQLFSQHTTCSCPFPKGEVQSILRTISSRSLQLVRDGIATPLDTVRGRSISHEVCELAFGLLFHKHIDTTMAIDFLNVFLRSGILHNERELGGSTPLEKAISSSLSFIYGCDENEGVMEAYTFLIQKLGCWSYQSQMDISISTVHNLLRIEDNLNLYEHSCSLISAIMVKSETVLMHELEVHGACTYRHSEYDVICSSIGWERGLSIILASGKFSPNDNLIKDAGNVHKNISFYDILDLAMQDKQIESLDILAQAGYPVYPQVWFASIQYCYDLTAEWIAYFRTWKATPGIGQDTTDSAPMQDRALGYFYIHVCLPIESANYLWKTGFTDLGLISSFPFVHHPFGPALWVQATKVFGTDCHKISLTFYRRSKLKLGVRWDFVKWLVDRGAELVWMHPILSTTPAHMIGTSLQYHLTYPWHSHQQLDAVFIKKILSLDHVDLCDCLCSERGCQVVGCASREVLVDFIGHEYRQMDKRQWKKFLYDVVDSTRPRDLQKGLAVIRVWTFEALKLTHTCCGRISTELDEIRPILEEEIDDIRYIERADIQIFHDLMEEFDEAWGNHNGSFEEFVDNIWSSRMERVRQEASEYDSDRIEKVKEIGVRLWEPFGPQAVK